MIRLLIDFTTVEAVKVNNIKNVLSTSNLLPFNSVYKDTEVTAREWFHFYISAIVAEIYS